MNETERYAIPSRLDDPERWLFWTLDEAAVLMGPAMLGLAANAFVMGLAVGVGGYLALRRIKRGGRAGLLMHAAYWLLPGAALRLQGAPPSHRRRFAG